MIHDLTKFAVQSEYLGIIELSNGNYYYVEKQGGKLIAGGCCNFGIFREVEVDYDPDLGLDGNLQELYEKLLEYDLSKSS